MRQPAHEERALAQIEAELRRSDPRLLALFDKLGRDGRPSSQTPAMRWRRFRIVSLLTAAGLAAAVGLGQAAGPPGRSAEAALADVQGRAVVAVQAQLHDWRQEIQALVWGSPPP